MPRSIDEFVSDLPPERQEKIKTRFEELREQYLELQDLRKTLGLTQEQVAEALDMDQGNLSRLEKRDDLMISTLRKYIEAMGGKMSISAEFPDQPTIKLKGFSED